MLSTYSTTSEYLSVCISKATSRDTDFSHRVFLKVCVLKSKDVIHFFQMPPAPDQAPPLGTMIGDTVLTALLATPHREVVTPPPSGAPLLNHAHHSRDTTWTPITTPQPKSTLDPQEGISPLGGRGPLCSLRLKPRRSQLTRSSSYLVEMRDPVM